MEIQRGLDAGNAQYVLGHEDDVESLCGRFGWQVGLPRPKERQQKLTATGSWQNRIVACAIATQSLPSQFGQMASYRSSCVLL